jgi:hypothetical protein
MKLLTPLIQLVLPKMYQTDEMPLKDKTVICKFFTPWSFWSWFVFEGKPDGKDYIFYGTGF